MRMKISFKKHEEVWEGVKKESETINGAKKVVYGKDFKKNRFQSNGGFPLNKPLNYTY